MMQNIMRRPSSCVTCKALPDRPTAPLPRPSRTEPPSTTTSETPKNINVEPLTKPKRSSSGKAGGSTATPLWTPRDRRASRTSANPVSSSPDSSVDSQTAPASSSPTPRAPARPAAQRRAAPPKPATRPEVRRVSLPSTDQGDEDGEYDEGEELGLSEEENERLVFGSVSNSWEAEVLASRAFHGTRTHHRNPLFDQVCQVASATPVQINSHAPVIMTCPPAEPESAALDATALTALQHQLLEMGVQQEVADALLLAVKQEKADAGVLPVQAQRMLTLAGGGESLTQALGALALELGCVGLVDVGSMAVSCPTLVSLDVEVVRERAQRLASTCGCLPLKATGMMMKNPALLIIPQDKLATKLTALKNSTGLSLEQATSMITLYMFPGIQG
ncbi:MAG: hypothetical protein WDW38_006795 [Sanguina aurantia]